MYLPKYIIVFLLLLLLLFTTVTSLGGGEDDTDIRLLQMRVRILEKKLKLQTEMTMFALDRLRDEYKSINETHKELDKMKD
jgi:hypothetical protein